MPETGKRACRACGESYVYPAPRSLATRFYCESCSGLDPAVRRVLEAMGRRLARLQAELDALRGTAGPQAEPGARQAAPRGSVGSD